MISAEEFKQKWPTETDKLVVFPKSAIEDVKLEPNVKVFLAVTGLPEEAAPFLNFAPPKKGALPRASETLWHLTPEFARYRVIGSNGCGDPVCIDEGAEGRIVYLNHDNYFEPIFMATSVFSLAECLLIFRDCIREAVDAGDTMTTERVEKLVKKLSAVDPAASEFWAETCHAFVE